MTTAEWRVERASGRAAAFHARPLDAPLARTIHVWSVDRPALVLGSGQRDDVVDRAACERHGVDVVRRQSGGGAVLLEPGTVAWFDVELPRADPLWDDDLRRAAWWVGARFGAAATSLGVVDPQVHKGGLERRPWSDLVCFAGLGPGEVTAGPGGPKLVGVSQRRTGAGARFQCAVLLTWEPARLVRLLRLPAPERARAQVDLAPVAVAVPRRIDVVIDACLAQLGLAGAEPPDL